LEKQGTGLNLGADRRLSADYSELTAPFLDFPGTQKQVFLLVKQGIKSRKAANNRKTVVVPRERIVVRWEGLSLSGNELLCSGRRGRKPGFALTSGGIAVRRPGISLLYGGIGLLHHERSDASGLCLQREDGQPDDQQKLAQSKGWPLRMPRTRSGG
jgi:hypothetical protein